MPVNKSDNSYNDFTNQYSNRMIDNTCIMQDGVYIDEGSTGATSEHIIHGSRLPVGNSEFHPSRDNSQS